MSQHVATSPHEDRRRGIVFEFFRALRSRFTYDPANNAECAFGFLWGLPIPLVTVAIHLHAAGKPFDFASVWETFVANPWFFVLLLHPVLFAVVFGAHGTMRSARDAQIRSLLAEREKQIEALNATNARLEELDRLKTELLANVTHELKSPLITALGYTDRVLHASSETLTDKQRERLEISKRNLIRLRTLIDEILDFSQLQAGVAKFTMAATDLKGAVVTAVENDQLKAREREIDIKVELPAEAATVKGDAFKLVQVFVNLLDNAIKYAPQKSSIRVTMSRNGSSWRCAVTDQGQGIPKELMWRLFQRFGQIDGTLARPHEGVGLGLMIVKRIVEMHGGKIWVDSAVGVGTTISIELPALAPSDTMGTKETEASHATHSTG